MTYIAQEPGIVEAYQDQRGDLHGTREAAIEANFTQDFHMACVDVLENHDPKGRFSAMPVLVIADFVRILIVDAVLTSIVKPWCLGRGLSSSRWDILLSSLFGAYHRRMIKGDSFPNEQKL